MKAISILIEKDKYLSEVLQNNLKLEGVMPGSLPSGRIDKKYTGIGATYCELEDQNRHSLVIVPTRAIAKAKSIQHSAYYVAGDSDKTTHENVRSIKMEIKSDSKKKIKVLIVADSLKWFIQTYGDEVYINFFILFDEIDTFQEESKYRQALQESLDYYKKFPNDKRAVVSATMGKFSDPEFEAEKLYEIKLAKKNKPKLELIHYAGDSSIVLSEYIKQKRNRTDRKFLIALNNLDRIRQTIELLEDDEKSVGILCSASRKDEEAVKDYYSELKDGQLQKRINFATSAYYLGIDVLEDPAPYMIVCADEKNPSSLLSKSRIIQFFGRSRKGIPHLTFIFNTSTRYKRTQIKARIDEKISLSLHILNSVLKTRQSPAIDDFLDKVESFFSSEAVESKVPIIRRVNGEFVKSYLYYDHLIHKEESLKQLYVDPVRTKDNLVDRFEINGVKSIIGPTTQNAKKRDKSTLISQNCMAILTGEGENGSSEAEKICKEIYGANNTCINKQEFIRIAYLAVTPFNNKSVSKLKDLKFQLEIYSQGSKSRFWQTFNTLFPMGNVLTNNEILSNMKLLFEIPGYATYLQKMKSTNAATRYLKLIADTKKVKSQPTTYKMGGLNEEKITDEFYADIPGATYSI